MPTDDPLIRHLATRVIGWREGRRYVGTSGGYIPIWENSEGVYQRHVNGWNPVGNWSDAGQLWEYSKAQHPEWGIKLEVLASTWWAHVWILREENEDGDILVSADSGPRAICEAVAKATGYKEGKDAS